MNNWAVRKLVFLIILFLPSIAFAQDNTNEILWLGAGVRVNPFSKLRLDLEHQVRLEDGFQEFRNTFTELGINYFPIKKLRLNTNYRYMVWDRGIRHRYSIEANYSHHLKKTRLFFHVRERYQSFVWQDNNETSNSIRSLITVGYKMSKLTRLYVKNEWFYALNEVNQFNLFRTTLGVNWNLTDQLILMTYYNYQTRINSEVKNITHMAAVRAIYAIKLNKT